MNINNEIIESANILRSELKRYFNLKFDLNFFWHESSYLDDLLWPLFGKKVLNDKEKSIINSASAFIGVMTYASWKTFDPSLNLKLNKNTNSEIIISATGGQLIPLDHSHESNITLSLLNLIKDITLAKSFISNKTENLLGSYKPITSLVKNLLCVKSIFAHGAINEAEDARLYNYLNNVHTFLAESTLTFLKDQSPQITEKFSEENLLKILKTHLIFPPLGVDEKFLGSRTIIKQIELYQSFGLQIEEIISLTNELAKINDKQIQLCSILLNLIFSTLDNRHPKQANPNLILNASLLPYFHTTFSLGIKLAAKLYDIKIDANSEFLASYQARMLPHIIIPKISNLPQNPSSEFLSELLNNKQDKDFPKISSLSEIFILEIQSAFLSIINRNLELSIKKVSDLWEKYKEDNSKYFILYYLSSKVFELQERKDLLVENQEKCFQLLEIEKENPFHLDFLFELKENLKNSDKQGLIEKIITEVLN